MAKKKPSASSIEIERLENEKRKLDKKLSKARVAENERRSLGTRRDILKNAEEKFEDLIERQTGYDTNEKARVFGFGAFDGALDGSLKWVRMNSIYAVEVELPSKDATNQNVITMLKTVDGVVDVSQSPSEVMDEFVKVRFAFEAEQIREMQSEQHRIEQKVADRKAKAKKKADKKDADDHEGGTTLADLVASGELPAGPDFAAVSKGINGDNDDEDLLFVDEDDEDKGDDRDIF